jgi:hypothetical protein
MGTKGSIKWSLVAAAAACVAVATSSGCELLVDFDRSKIDAGGGEGGVGPDATTQDGPTTETSTEAGDDTTAPETSTEAGADSTIDAPVSDAGSDAKEAAAETGAEPVPEAGPEPTPEAGPDTGPDAPDDTGSADGATE